ncbi:MAG: SDR family NAD(P)-dependent oxidoreductase [Candidatus Eisenbacteria bacterium]|nr:SDR family NAD(P)-dependent oxidoreductase [Candidatus Eisenbacteria bacterium]
MSEEAEFGLEIAIVGLAGRFPGAETLERFWENLRAGVESIRDLSERELDDAGVDEATRRDPRFVRRAADLAGVELFDAELFGFSPREAELTDPQFRIFLEDAWSALEDAGRLSDRRGERVGVFAGASASSYYAHHIATNPRIASVGALQAALGNTGDYLATQVSYRLDLRGPSLTVQTACSTSLVAVHLACQSLLNRECDVALAGGVSISLPQTAGYLHEEGDIASPDGRCRAFDAAAGGCIKGNGSGVVILRRLEDALRDGDPIRAVIKGTAVNNDGADKVGFTAPSISGQAAVITEALAVAGVDPASISYIETHGTATALGDPIELAALRRAFGPDAGRERKCAMASIKTNLGHLDAAAGVAGLIKTSLALAHRELPPSLHFERANPKLELESSPFYVNATLRSWPAEPGQPRRAGVSSFGIGGTNAHVILEEAPNLPASAGDPGPLPQVLVLSARSESALRTISLRLADHLESKTSRYAEAGALADLAYTLQVGRRRLSWRRTVVARSASEAASQLRAPVVARQEDHRQAPVAFLFPGQGAQRPGMAHALHRDHPVFRQALDRCLALLRPMVGEELGALLLAAPETSTASDAARLRDTALAQPALFAVGWSLAQLWISWGVHPAALAGHSIGEYVAACLAGILTLEDAVSLVALRGQSMSELPAGAMLALSLDEATTRGRIEHHPDLALAAVNGPRSCVVSGPEEAIERFGAELAAEEIAARRLHTSHAFHSSMMDPILPRFEAAVRAVRLSPPSLPIGSNQTGTWMTAEQATDALYWVRHLRETVRFADNLAAVNDDPTQVLLEVGPGQTITSMAKAVKPTCAVATSMPSEASPGAADALAIALAQLWTAGVAIDWEAVHGAPRRRVSAPTYAFDRGRFWIEPGAAAAGAANSPEGDGATKNPNLSEWFYLPGWKRVPFPPPAAAEAISPVALLLDDGSPLADRLAAELGTNQRVLRVRAGSGPLARSGDWIELDPTARDAFDALWRDLRAESLLPRCVVSFWSFAPGHAEETAALDRGFFALLHLLGSHGQASSDPPQLLIVTRALLDVAADALADPWRAAVIGIARVAPQEYPGLTARLIDFSGSEIESTSVLQAEQLRRELESADPEPVVAWRGRHRFVPSFDRVPAERPAALSPGAVVLFSGGAGPLEIALATRLASEGARGFGFLSTSPELPPELAALRARGVEIVTAAESVVQAEAVDRLASELRARTGRIDLAVLSAHEIGGGMIQLRARVDAERVILPRLQGARNLESALRAGETLVLVSSAISVAGVFGQADYCGASAALDAMAQAAAADATRARSKREAAVPGPRVVAVDFGVAFWDRWQESKGPGGAALRSQLREIQEAIGIGIEEGVEALLRALALDEPQIVVTTQDLPELIAQSLSVSTGDIVAGVRAGAEGGGHAQAGGRFESETERQVAEVWSELLGVPTITRQDNFFDLGGNSLIAIQLASQLRKRFEIDLSIANLFESSDLVGLAAAVDRAREERLMAEEVARLLDEIEGLSEDEIRAELERGAGAGE